LKLFAVLVQDFEVVSEIVEYAPKHTVNVSAHEFLAIFTAEIVYSDLSLVGSLSQNDNVVFLQVPGLSSELSLGERNLLLGRSQALNVEVELLQTMEASLDSILAEISGVQEELGG
jgi:hypothetical protein